MFEYQRLTMLNLCSVTLIMFAVVLNAQNVTDNDVRLPPTITTAPLKKLDYFRVASDDLKTFECGAIGFPTPTYEWRKNGIVLDIYNTSNIRVQYQGTIVISPRSAQDAGEYQCFVSNKWGKTATDIATLKMATLNSFTSTGEAIKTGVAGQSLTLRCNPPSSVPAASYSWAISKGIDDLYPTVITLNDRIQVDQQTGDLFFAYASPTDSNVPGSMYRCNAYNPYLATTIGGSYQTLNVSAGGSSTAISPSYAFSTSSPTTALIGKSASLVCFYYGFPVPAISWMKDGGELPAGRYQLINSNTTLQINDVELSDQGLYQCTAANTVNRVSFSIQLNVQSEPTFIDYSYPININATAGQTVIFNCDATGNPTPAITLYSNMVPLNQYELSPRYSLTNNQKVLTISNVCKACSDGTSDLQVIQCKASNSNGFIFASGYLNVLDATIITSAPENQELNPNSITVLTCESAHDPSTLITVNWYYNGDELIEEPNLVYVNAAGSLCFNTPKLPDGGAKYAGNYTCVVSNGYSSDQASFYIGPVNPNALQTSSFADYWWVLLIIFILLLFVLLVIVVFKHLRDNRGDAYPVDTKERENGNDPDRELQDSAFQDYQRLDAAPLLKKTNSVTGSLNLTSDDGRSWSTYNNDVV